MNKTAKELIKLGYKQPELRPHLRPVLDELTKTSSGSRELGLYRDYLLQQVSGLRCHNVTVDVDKASDVSGSLLIGVHPDTSCDPSLIRKDKGVLEWDKKILTWLQSYARVDKIDELAPVKVDQVSPDSYRAYFGIKVGEAWASRVLKRALSKIRFPLDVSPVSRDRHTVKIHVSFDFANQSDKFTKIAEATDAVKAAMDAERSMYSNYRFKVQDEDFGNSCDLTFTIAGY